MVKPTINCGTIGHVDHGKTTTTAALATYFSCDGKKYGIGDIDNHKEEQERGITINIRSVRYETPNREVNHVDCPGHEDFIKNMITGASSLNVAILIVSAVDGAQKQTKEHIKVASATKIMFIIVVFNKMDQIPESDLELVAFAKEELFEILEANGYEESQIQWVELSATIALNEVQQSLPPTKYGIEALKKIGEAIDAVDLNDHSMKDKLPFCLTIEDTYAITGRGPVIAGKVNSGILERKGMGKLEIISKKGDKRILVDITDMHIFNKPVDRISTGANAALLIKGIDRDQISRGDIIVALNAYPSFHFAKVQLHLFTASEGGRKTGIGLKYTPHVFLGARDTPAEIIRIEGNDIIEPGSVGECWLAFASSMIQDPDGKSLIIRESNSTIGYGIILESTNVPPIAITEAFVKSSQLMIRVTKALKINPLPGKAAAAA